MEGTRKRKRSAENGEAKTCDDRPKQGHEATAPSSERKDDDDDNCVAAPPPSEAEVEEFYAILRRMRTAVKYFNDVRDRRESGREAVRSGGGLQLDLNSVPESENNVTRP